MFGVGGGGTHFTKEIPLNEISGNHKNVLKNRGGVNFTKEIPFKKNQETPKFS